MITIGTLMLSGCQNGAGANQSQNTEVTRQEEETSVREETAPSDREAAGESLEAENAATEADLFGDNRGFGVLMTAAIAVPLYACGGTIPLLQAWLADGMSMGSAAAFMITGPATKIMNLGAVKNVLGAKRFALYLLFTITLAFLSGWVIDGI